MTSRELDSPGNRTSAAKIGITKKNPCSAGLLSVGEYNIREYPASPISSRDILALVISQSSGEFVTAAHYVNEIIYRVH
jgi:hypothetical protein